MQATAYWLPKGESDARNKRGRIVLDPDYPRSWRRVELELDLPIDVYYDEHGTWTDVDETTKWGREARQRYVEAYQAGPVRAHNPRVPEAHPLCPDRLVWPVSFAWAPNGISVLIWIGDTQALACTARFQYQEGGE